MGRGSYLGGCTIVGPRSGWFTFSKNQRQPVAYPPAKVARAFAARELERLRRSHGSAGDLVGASEVSQQRSGSSGRGSARHEDREKIDELRRQLETAQRRRSALASASGGGGSSASAIERELLDEHVSDLAALIRRVED